MVSGKRGFTVVELVVTAGVLGPLLLVVWSILSSFQAQVIRANGMHFSESTLNEAYLAFRDKDTCKANFENVNLGTLPQFNTLVMKTGVDQVTLVAKYANLIEKDKLVGPGGTKISRIQLLNPKPMGTSFKFKLGAGSVDRIYYTSDLEIEMQIPNGKGALNTVTRKIPLSFLVNVSDNKVVNCGDIHDSLSDRFCSSLEGGATYPNCVNPTFYGRAKTEPPTTIQSDVIVRAGNFNSRSDMDIRDSATIDASATVGKFSSIGNVTVQGNAAFNGNVDAMSIRVSRICIDDASGRKCRGADSNGSCAFVVGIDKNGRPVCGSRPW